MNYTIRYNATTNHIAGHGIKATLATEFTMNHCGSLTRSRLAEGKSFETAAEALAYIETNARKVCKTCLKALVAAVEAEAAELAAQVAETAPVAQIAAETVAEVATQHAPVVAALNGRAPVWTVQHQGRTMWTFGGAGLYTSRQRAEAALKR